MRPTVRTPLERQATTFASWLEALGPGSPCFCCGAPLCDSSVATETGHTGTRALTCSRCNAGVSPVGAPAIAPFVRPRQTSLAAA